MKMTKKQKEELKTMEKLQKKLDKLVNVTRENLDKMEQLFYKAYLEKIEKTVENE